MFKKIILAGLIIVLLAAAFGWYMFKTSKTSFKTNTKTLYIYSNNATKDALLAALKKDSITDVRAFEWMAGYKNLWENIKPGRYKIKSGTSVYELVGILRNGIQTPVDFVISRKLRYKEDFARLAGNNFECDSAQVMTFLNNKDSLKHLGLDTATWLTAIIHNTYSIPWTYSPAKIFSKLYNDQQAFWAAENRLEKAQGLGYTPKQIYTLASIVASETNLEKDKPNVASVYLNRLSMGMKLQADPTLIFALKDFTIKRVLNVHMQVNSPYNTYMHEGLPPGPICTVEASTLDAVLNAPKTHYIFFVAEPGLTGASSFSSTLAEHSILAKAYQEWLGGYLKKKLEQEKAKKDSIAKATKP
ncbi:MAG: endolytic transglycosylase MltG [Chitinophagaceae bacterium]